MTRFVTYSLVPFLPAILFFLSLTGNLSAQQRVALVIGIDDYGHVGALQNAVNDADSMSRVLSQLNFKVTRAVNLDQPHFLQTISEFFDQLHGADCALFYFAGHGIQAQGQNFLIPNDFSPESQDDLWRTAVPLDRVISSLVDGQPKVSLIILDACLDNPLHDPKHPSKISLEGLAPTNPPLGSLIAYAADVGQKAADGGNSPNGLYTGVLTRFMNQPGLRVEDVFNETRKKVYKESQGNQSPAEYSKLVNTFYFQPNPGQQNLPDAVVLPKTDILASVQSAPATPSPALTALRHYYERVNQRDFPAAYGMLSASHRQRRPLEHYREIFNDTLGIYPTRLDVSKQDGDKATIFVNLVVIDKDRNRTRWFGPVEMANEEGVWKMDTGVGLMKISVKSLLAEGGIPSQDEIHPAVMAVQTYYRGVNLREFTGSYRLLSRGFQSRRSVQQYSEVFNSTLSVYLLTHLLKWSTPGSAGVFVELAVLGHDGKRSTWHGTVELVKENDHWKIDSMKDVKPKD